MPARKSEDAPPPEEKTPVVSRADVAEPAPAPVAPEPVPLAGDQVEVELPDGSTAIVDKVMADAMKAAKAKGPQASVKQLPPETVK
jgi:hypothetical protein